MTDPGPRDDAPSLDDERLAEALEGLGTAKERARLERVLADDPALATRCRALARILEEPVALPSLPLPEGLEAAVLAAIEDADLLELRPPEGLAGDVLERLEAEGLVASHPAHAVPRRPLRGHLGRGTVWAAAAALLAGLALGLLLGGRRLDAEEEALRAALARANAAEARARSEAEASRRRAEERADALARQEAQLARRADALARQEAQLARRADALARQEAQLARRADALAGAKGPAKAAAQAAPSGLREVVEARAVQRWTEDRGWVALAPGTRLEAAALLRALGGAGRLRTGKGRTLRLWPGVLYRVGPRGLVPLPDPGAPSYAGRSLPPRPRATAPPPRGVGRAPRRGDRAAALVAANPWERLFGR
ncbi:MAG: hypothetical protein D6731_19020 [Planctomycetota bacterium]|nr:MAG: hypothetical protein D6731_19020 [Planctomycetota bacterium]